MNNDQSNSYPQPPPWLLEKVLKRIDLERKLRAMRRRFGLALATLISISGALVPVWRAFWADISQSGFDQFFKLALYDFKTVLANWQDFTLSLLESLPVLSTVILLIVILALLLSLKFTVKNGKAFFAPSSFRFIKS
jgi:hypothetical protein